MTLSEIICLAIEPALRLLPPAMDTVKARVMLLAIGLQESAFAARRQAGNGPARGFWQFELGTPQSRGGVWGCSCMSPVGRTWSAFASRGVSPFNRRPFIVRSRWMTCSRPVWRVCCFSQTPLRFRQ